MITRKHSQKEQEKPREPIVQTVGIANRVIATICSILRTKYQFIPPVEKTVGIADVLLAILYSIFSFSVEEPAGTANTLIVII